MDIEEQIAIALYRFGHYGNGSSTMKVALQFGVGYGTVRLVTNCVLASACSEPFRKSTLQWTSDAGKEDAKAWVESNSCPAWRNGWCMVDGTLIPLFRRPSFFGNVWFDRKSNYSLNLQVRLHVLTENHYLTNISCRLSQHLIFESSILGLDCLVVSMMQVLGSRPGFHKNGRFYSEMMNGFGLTLRIHYKIGVRLHIRSMSC
jgi:hypothetical protein